MTSDNKPSTSQSAPNPRSTSARIHLYYETRILLLALATGFPGSAIALFLIWSGGHSLKVELTVTLFIGICWFGFALSLRDRIITTFRTLSNLLSAYHEGDYSLRAIHRGADDVLQETTVEINAIGETLRSQRISAMEASSLLRKVMDEIDVAIFAFDENAKARLCNLRAQKLLGLTEQAIQRSTADELGLTDVLSGESPRIIEFSALGASGRWELRRGEFRLEGKPHTLIVLSDLTHTLRDEERKAWKRLVQVLRHEINNTLAPIHSLSDSLCSMLKQSPRADDWEDDLMQGLKVIRDRSASLNRFMDSYSRLTKMPEPQKQAMNLHDCIQRVVNLVSNPAVKITSGPEATVDADAAQIEQALINLVKNAIEALGDEGGSVEIHWSNHAKPSPHIEIQIEDTGAGVLNAENLFVPFFTTKSQGIGLGLMIARQIAESHGGSLTLENRTDGNGCIARLILPAE
ncbi:PAS domain-containing sensor histidine kinase [bacterium]|nr:PAS domain-containing sensor histidine kinase [bacterium]